MREPRANNSRISFYGMPDDVIERKGFYFVDCLLVVMGDE